MTKPADTRLVPEVAREVCERAGGKAYIAGSIANLGKDYVIGLKTVNCQTGDLLAQEQAQADGKEQVLDALGSVATKLRGKLGESLSTVAAFDVPLDQATTPSFEALQAYSLGRKSVFGKGDDAAGVPFFQRAIRLDPNFAMAYHLCTGDLQKALQAYELWAQTYPRNPPAGNLGVIYFYLCQYDKTLAENSEAVRLNPASAQSYANLVSSYLSLNRLEEAQATAKEAQAKNLDSPTLRLNLY
jgi:tetratricopeptide (TPR) repeat protein